MTYSEVYSEVDWLYTKYKNGDMFEREDWLRIDKIILWGLNQIKSLFPENTLTNLIKELKRTERTKFGKLVLKRCEENLKLIKLYKVGDKTVLKELQDRGFVE